MAHLRSEKIGLPPGALVPVGDGPASPTTIRVFVYNAEQLEEHEPEGPEDLQVGDPGTSVTWIDVTGLADVRVLESIGDRFGLHRLLLEDVLNSDHRPTVDEYQDHLFVVMKTLGRPSGKDSDEDLRMGQISFVLTQGVVISFQDGPTHVLDPVRERLRNSTGRLRGKKADFLLYSLLDVIVDNYFTIVEDLGDRMEDLEDRIAERPRPTDLAEMQDLRRQLILVNRQVMPTRELTGHLNIIPSELIGKGTRRYINDLQEHSVYLAESMLMFREQLSNVQNTYHAGINMRMGEVMKLLTIISTVFIPLTFIAGVYGMNFTNMPELEWRYGYAAVMGLMLLIVLVMLWWFRRKDWI